MKAAVYTRYGPPNVLRVVEAPKPVHRDDELLVQVYAATVNRTDCGFLRGEPRFVRLFSGLFTPNKRILGNEFAGRVEAVGTHVHSFAVGDRIFGYSGVNFGAQAEYLTVKESGLVALIPQGLTFEQAAPSTEGAHYALNHIRAAGIEAGHDVLVNGATGAIGSAAVQLLRHAGARVTAVCATANVELVRSLGADRVIDYTKEDFTRTSDLFDVVFDEVGKSSFGRCKPILKPQGIYLSSELGPRAENPVLALTTRFSRSTRVMFPIPRDRREDVIFLKHLMFEGKFTPIIDRTYPLTEIVEAYDYVETGMKVGNVVIRVAQER
ncbi:NADPH:quinone oxidoreductase [Cryobacterium sp. MLB-32]|uniref:NAD(P)-dependent alcohol dehydrogenase n=1 Tax=Cryobacterium sp. MLB-32 TaxID=1529318 RepID=UPI0004E6981D|nr:NAD(P)-dependent alcohol dehydrogenase [Cryobacterium sp. MLB-32]KFF60337.1 NADPH:quinone oxidoreductase [Cryobacterium sp. MLB-32]